MVACRLTSILAFAAVASSFDLKADKLCRNGSCLAQDENVDEEHIHLLQVGSSKEAVAKEAQPSQWLDESVAAAQVRAAEHLNATSEAMCVKHTGGTCAFSSQCDESRSAQCNNGLCVCPKYACAKEGKCAISAAEIQKGLEKAGTKAKSVVASITESAAKIPGLADSAGAVQGVWNTLGGFAGSVFGSSGCSGYIGLCWKECDDAHILGFTASCSYGSCQCQEGFCAKDGKCEFDVSGMISGAAQGVYNSIGR